MVDSTRNNLDKNGENKVRVCLIGLLVAKSNGLLRRSLKSLVSLAELCDNGQVAVFSLKGIDRDKQFIQGYLYCSSEKTWIPSTFPIPNAIINRISLNRKWKGYFRRILGRKMINNFTFNKWQMYQWLSNNQVLRNYLPKTQLLTADKDLINFLEQNKEAYIKPIFGSFGRGIMKISKHEELYKIDFSFTKNQKKSSYLNKKELIAYFKDKKSKYIIQQVIDLYIGARPTDFRLIAVKNELGKWQDLGIIARKGRRGGLVSNTGMVKSGNPALQNLLSIPRNEAVEIRKKMTQISIDAAKLMEKYGGTNGNLGNLGIDLAIDRNRNLWIIEMNHRNPRHKMAIDAGELDVYISANKSLLNYADHLAKLT
ncbi:MAG: YheC/YheD family protein [Anaerobacillus sp.]|uniref:YheC/YheD family endospore coat-associated protein n=1 Tax=Anaerobacillus sp. TaxID=1872506 RepID=UPI003919F691